LRIVSKNDIRVAGGELGELEGIDRRDPCLLAWHINLDVAKAEIPVKPLWLSIDVIPQTPAAILLPRPFVDPSLRTH